MKGDETVQFLHLILCLGMIHTVKQQQAELHQPHPEERLTGQKVFRMRSPGIPKFNRYKDGRENKPVKDRRSLEGLFNFTFQSFLAGKYLSSTNEPGHIRNRLSTALLYSGSISPCESYSETECSDEQCYSTSLSSEQTFQAGL